jgi:hypothetical protein
MLAGGQAEIACEVSARGEAVGVADERHQCRGGEQPDAGDRAQLADERHGRGECGELLLHRAEARFELADFGRCQRAANSPQVGAT